MKKKIYILVLLLLLIIPFKVKAYSYNGNGIYSSYMKNQGWITSWPTVGDTYVVGPNAVSHFVVRSYFYYHQVSDGSKKYAVICSNIGKIAGEGGANSTSDIPLSLINGIDSIRDSSGNLLTEQKKELLKDLLVNGYHYDTTFTKTIYQMSNSKEDTLSMLAMQLLVWEVVEGGRTSFETVAPQYNPSNSAYNMFIYPNGGNSSQTETLYYFYKKIVNEVYSASHPSDAPAFNTESYTMSWDSTNKRYAVSITGIGKYKTCTSSSPDVRVDNITNGITVTTTKVVNNVNITCSYMTGSGTADSFFYFKFNNIGVCGNDGDCQNLVYGAGKKTYSKNLKVSSENTSLKIKKYGIDKKEVSGATFRLTHRINTDYSLTINGNASNATAINKSGEFIVSETSVPSGYEKLRDFNITIDARTNKITNCSDKGTNTAGNMTCLSGQVEVGYENDVIVLKVVDVAKNFKIQKVDENNRPIKGATFQIYNSSNQLMKFNLYTGNIFGYNANGNVTDIHLDDSYSYPIALLPEGEYTILETSVPFPYRKASSEEDNKTKIKINSSRDMLVYDESQQTYVASVNATVKIKNYRTLIKVKKTGSGRPLPGVKFLLYNENRTEEIKCELESDGVYSYQENYTSANNTVFVTNSDGLITIKDLPAGTYYFREIETVGNYVLPEGEAAYVKAVIKVTKNGVTINGSLSMDTIVISNTLTSFNFYKIDEDGNYLTTGKFKLQRYDDEKNRYVDLKLEKVDNDGSYDENADLFKESSNGKVQFGLTNGIATFINMKPSSKYRIVETVAPDGYVKQPVSDTANVTLDEFGNANGLLVLTNQKVLREDGQAQAELVVNIQTGQTRVKYAIIIGSIIIIIGLLVYLQSKKK